MNAMHLDEDAVIVRVRHWRPAYATSERAGVPGAVPPAGIRPGRRSHIRLVRHRRSPFYALSDVRCEGDTT
jgi:hypothetical protein